jgi:hypothetical protein
MRRMLPGKDIRTQPWFHCPAYSCYLHDATLGCKKRADSLLLTMDDKLAKPQLSAWRCDGASGDERYANRYPSPTLTNTIWK